MTEGSKGVREAFWGCGRGMTWPHREWKRNRVRPPHCAVRHTVSQVRSGAHAEQAGDRGQPGWRFYQVVPWRERRAKALSIFAKK